MAEAKSSRGKAPRGGRSSRANFFRLNDLPNDLLVSVFEAIGDLRYVRHTFPLVNKAWNELYCSQAASPLHETLELDFWKESAAARAVERQRDSELRALKRKERQRKRVKKREKRRQECMKELRRQGYDGSSDWDDPGENPGEWDDPYDSDSEDWELDCDTDSDDEWWEHCPPVTHASRVISWAERRAGWIRKLHIKEGFEGAFKDFKSRDFGAPRSVSWGSSRGASRSSCSFLMTKKLRVPTTPGLS